MRINLIFDTEYRPKKLDPLLQMIGELSGENFNMPAETRMSFQIEESIVSEILKAIIPQALEELNETETDNFIVRIKGLNRIEIDYNSLAISHDKC